MKLYYLEHYPHYTGTMDTVIQIDAMFLALLLTLVKEGEQELAQEVACDFTDNTEVYAFHFVFDTGPRVRSIKRALGTKGIWADFWDEGSHAICEIKNRNTAIRALAQLEAKVFVSGFNK